MKEYKLYRMTWPEVKDGVEKIDAVFIPVGSTEQHGRHLPVECDHFTATHLCERAAKSLNERGKWVIVAPTINYGCSWYHINFPGTISLSQKTFMEVVKDVCISLAHHGFKNLIVFNAHGGNSATLTTSLTDLYAEKGIRVAIAQWWTFITETIKELGITSPLIHAEEVETSIAMALGLEVRVKELTRDAFSRQEVHKAKGVATSKHIAYDGITPGSGVTIPMDYIDDISHSGVVGDATLASKENGEKLSQEIISSLVDFVEDLTQTQESE
jgi:creatinine amidohydrolase